MSNTIQWIWLTKAISMNSKKISYLLDEYGDIDSIYNSTTYNGDYLTAKDKNNLADKSLMEAANVYKAVCNCGAFILTYDNPHYPECLKAIDDIPYVLYLKGKPIDLDNILGIGVVGTRNNTKYGEQCATMLASELGKRGAVIISGMALGIDCIAMHAAIKTGARTIGVLGCGIDMIYPSTNKWLFEETLKNGLIISEYPPETMATRYTFPQRNRIIAALSKGVLVIEGAAKSGSMITAKYAEKYGRELFALPRNIGDKNDEGILMDGTNELIKNGAHIITSADDIVERYYQYEIKLNMTEEIKNLPEYEDVPKSKSKAQPEEHKEEAAKPDITELLARTDDDKEKSVMKLIAEESLYPDEIAMDLDGGAGDIGVILTIMETKGLIKRQPDGRYGLSL